MSIPVGFLRVGVWKNILRVREAAIPGNMEGEGRLLGGTVHSFHFNETIDIRVIYIVHCSGAK